MSTLRHNVANVISASYTLVKLSLMKLMYPQNIFFGPVERFSPSVMTDVDKKSKIVFGNKVSIHSRCRISSNSGGYLTIGDRTSFNVGCIVVCKKRVNIGKSVSFGPNVMIYDHDHIMGKENGVKNTGFQKKDIIIGDNCWIGAGSIILSGAKIGDNCIIAAGSVIKGVVPNNTLVIQKKESTMINIGCDYE